ncbi:hypothetical protein SDC9_106787 [bioreactor metagenome]|uniref:Uncharacterized protein n=1 Tax=bioreactor metagenome TaxID=1076179 RepID=A0A645B5Q0_9ZZZZ
MNGYRGNAGVHLFDRFAIPLFPYLLQIFPQQLRVRHRKWSERLQLLREHLFHKRLRRVRQKHPGAGPGVKELFLADYRGDPYDAVRFYLVQADHPFVVDNIDEGGLPAPFDHIPQHGIDPFYRVEIHTPFVGQREEFQSDIIILVLFVLIGPADGGQLLQYAVDRTLRYPGKLLYLSYAVRLFQIFKRLQDRQDRIYGIKKFSHRSSSPPGRSPQQTWRITGQLFICAHSRRAAGRPISIRRLRIVKNLAVGHTHYSFEYFIITCAAAAVP